MINQNNLIQLNNVISNKHGSLLDLVFASSPSTITEPVECPILFETDHTVLAFNFNLTFKVRRQKTRTVYSFKKSDFGKLRGLIFNVCISSDINEALLTCNERLNDMVNNCIPQVIIKNSSTPPWIDGDVRHIYNCKITAWAAARHSNNTYFWSKFKRLRNNLKNIIRDKRRRFMIEMSENNKSNAKRFWTFCRLKTKSRLLPAVLSSGSEEAISPEDKSTMFNNHFFSVFNNNTSDINLPEVNIRINSNLSHIVFSEKDVFLVLKRLDINKESGSIDIPLRVLHECAAELTPSLTALFNMSMSNCTMPDAWKHAYVVPIYKKGEKCKVDNYRPISLLNGVSKIMERLVFNHVYHSVYPMMNSAQHGFIKNRSTTSQLVDMYSSMGKNMDAGIQTDIIFLDFF